MNPFLSSHFLSSIRSSIPFLLFKTFKIQFHGVSPHCIKFKSVNTHLHVKDDTFEPVNIDILFLNKIC